MHSGGIAVVWIPGGISVNTYSKQNFENHQKRKKQREQQDGRMFDSTLIVN